MDVSIRELKNRLSEYLRRVQAGEEVTVTLRGRQIARLSAIAERARPEVTEAAMLAWLDTQPSILAPRRSGKPVGSDRPLPWSPGQKTAEDIVRELRD